MDGGAWWATFHRVTNSRTQLSDFTHSLWRVKNMFLSLVAKAKTLLEREVKYSKALKIQ